MLYSVQYIPEGRIVMKKMLVVLCAVVFIGAASGALADAVFKASYDLSGTGKMGSLENDVEAGWSLAAEYYMPVINVLQIGGGAEYQFSRSASGGTGGNFNFIPVYGAVRVVIPIPTVKPYAIGRIGYNFFLGDDDFKGGTDLKGGLTYGLGAGVILFKFVLVEGQYSVNKGSLGSTDFTYSKFSISAGINLGF
jgi:hypothetical protein